MPGKWVSVARDKEMNYRGSVRTHSHAGSEGAVTQEGDFTDRPGFKL